MSCQTSSGKLRNGQGYMVLLVSESRAFRTTLHSAFYFPRSAFYRHPELATKLVLWSQITIGLSLPGVTTAVCI